MSYTLFPIVIALSLGPLGCGAPPGSDPGSDPVATQAPQGPPPTLTPQSTPLPLPEAAPFEALTRTSPITLVDGRGGTLLVLQGLGTRVEVIRLMADRALVRCLGCRAPLEGWLQRAALLPADGSADPTHTAMTDDDRLLLWLLNSASAEQLALLGAGLVDYSGGWIAPPWHGEGGYTLGAVTVAATDDAWTLGALATPTPAPAPPEESP